MAKDGLSAQESWKKVSGILKRKVLSFWKILQDLSALQQAEFEAHGLRWQKTAFERQMRYSNGQASD